MDAIDVVAANRVGRAPNVAAGRRAAVDALLHAAGAVLIVVEALGAHEAACAVGLKLAAITRRRNNIARSEEHTSELQSLMRISYAVFCLKKKKTYTIYIYYPCTITYNKYTEKIQIKK